jgi:tRNA(Ile)-lysidine synthase
VALLHLLAEFASENAGEIVAAHLNYGLRDAESDGDEDFCRELCEKLGVRLFIERRSLKDLRSGNLQEKARQIRYKFFERLCEQHGFPLIAIGHNADDNAETILLNLGRGAGTFGLAGMAERSGKLIRPLLGFRRREILLYLAENGIEYRTDSSNLSSKYRRNQVRQRLIPELETVFGTEVIANIGRAGLVMSEQADYLIRQAEKCFTRVASTTRGGKIVIAWQRLKRYHTLLRRLVLALAYRRLSGSLRGFELAATERLLALAAKGTGRADFIAGFSGEAIDDRLYIYGRQRTISERKLMIPGEVSIGSLSCRILSSVQPSDQVSDRSLRQGGRVAFLDRSKVKGNLTVRSPRAGDRFRPLGLSGTKKLSDFFVDRKIDRPLRAETPIVLDREKIIWVAGYEISASVRVTAATRRILKLELEDLTT